jgi:hypothetical protein
MADNVTAPPLNKAVSWRQQWYDGLETASQLWFANQDAQGMLDVLTPPHKMIEQASPASQTPSLALSVLSP